MLRNKFDLERTTANSSDSSLPSGWDVGWRDIRVIRLGAALTQREVLAGDRDCFARVERAATIEAGT